MAREVRGEGLQWQGFQTCQVDEQLSSDHLAEPTLAAVRALIGRVPGRHHLALNRRRVLAQEDVSATSQSYEIGGHVDLVILGSLQRPVVVVEFALGLMFSII